MDTVHSHLGVTGLMTDKPGLVADLVTDTVAIHASTDTLPVPDKSAKDLVDMDPEQLLPLAPAVRDIHRLCDKVLIHAGRIAAPECAPVSDTFFTRLRYRS